MTCWMRLETKSKQEKTIENALHEIFRKEGVINDANAKATRLIKIIRGKNQEIKRLERLVQSFEGCSRKSKKLIFKV